VRRIPTVILWVTIASGLCAGCKKEDRADLAIRLRKGTYEKWLKQQRPFLATIPKSAILEYEFTTLETETNVLPYFHYQLKAGDWDGILSLWLILKLDAKGNPVGMGRETVTFIRLPARSTALDEEGKLRNHYYGFRLNPAEATAATKRAAAGEDFDDYRKRADESGGEVRSRLDYNDPWKNLRKP
jgi:hypothetical protein